MNKRIKGGLAFILLSAAHISSVSFGEYFSQDYLSLVKPSESSRIYSSKEHESITGADVIELGIAGVVYAYILRKPLGTKQK
jgi:hypothetical protein